MSKLHRLLIGILLVGTIATGGEIKWPEIGPEETFYTLLSETQRRNMIRIPNMATSFAPGGSCAGWNRFNFLAAAGLITWSRTKDDCQVKDVLSHREVSIAALRANRDGEMCVLYGLAKDDFEDLFRKMEQSQGKSAEEDVKKYGEHIWPLRSAIANLQIRAEAADEVVPELLLKRAELFGSKREKKADVIRQEAQLIAEKILNKEPVDLGIYNGIKDHAITVYGVSNYKSEDTEFRFIVQDSNHPGRMQILEVKNGDDGVYWSYKPSQMNEKECEQNRSNFENTGKVIDTGFRNLNLTDKKKRRITNYHKALKQMGLPCEDEVHIGFRPGPFQTTKYSGEKEKKGAEKGKKAIQDKFKVHYVLGSKVKEPKDPKADLQKFCSQFRPHQRVKELLPTHRTWQP